MDFLIPPFTPDKIGYQESNEANAVGLVHIKKLMDEREGQEIGCRYTLEVSAVVTDGKSARPARGPVNKDRLQAKSPFDYRPLNPDAQSHQHEHGEELEHCSPNEQREGEGRETATIWRRSELTCPETQKARRSEPLSGELQMQLSHLQIVSILAKAR